jgi:hypothetical protein
MKFFFFFSSSRLYGMHGAGGFTNKQKSCIHDILLVSMCGWTTTYKAEHNCFSTHAQKTNSQKKKRGWMAEESYLFFDRLDTRGWHHQTSEGSTIFRRGGTHL